MRPSLTALIVLVLASGSASAAERSFGFIQVGQDGRITQSLSTRTTAVSGGSYRNSYHGSGADDRGDRYRDGEPREHGGWRDGERSGARFHPRGSFLYVSHEVNPTDRPYIPALDDVAYGGSGTYDPAFSNSRGYGRGDAEVTPAPSFPSDPKIIHIDSERLDRKPVGSAGIEVISNGGPKIIRIAPGYSRSDRRQASAEAAPQQVASAYLQPWSEAWMKHCIKAFRSFNPELGTYLDAAGRTRFCTADE